MISVLLLAFALVADVRQALNSGNFEKAEALVAESRKSGDTAENLEALSWLGRGALAAKNHDAADRYALETEHRVVQMLKLRKLDADQSLPLALGAAIEVQAHVLTARGERDRALSMLREQIAKYRDTSIRARLQKNINLIDLEGKPAPALDITEHIGATKPHPLASLKGKPVLVFLWAHWCADCKAQGPVLARLAREHAAKGLTIVAPTQLYGTAAGGADAGPAVEKRHIGSVLAESYSDLKGIAVPLSSETFKQYGVSTTPTLVLIDRAGIVRMYRPGRMTYEELAPRVAKIL
jgi:thiol-disulfide isomerase/thioredoxin